MHVLLATARSLHLQQTVQQFTNAPCDMYAFAEGKSAMLVPGEMAEHTKYFTTA